MTETTTYRPTGTDDASLRDGSIPAATPEPGLRWRAPWLGAIVALPVYLVLQLLCLAFGWLGPERGDATSGIVSAVLGVVALLVGGAACGATSHTRTAPGTALLEGAATWALTVLAVVGLGLAGAGSLVGSLGGAATTLGTGAAPTAEGVQHAAGWAALWLGVAFVAAIAGSLATREAGAAVRRRH
ncbi:hypothetical protein [Actinomycetospora sp. TBRC 11914]|uniref:hypothetical protein n=1 Tax=Actinomycetospora sp. TBRC 11914 TaxID=2729387 RepID=UPI00145EBF6C|nr:hypothetical protein [Actinomycetospora sp. TBRC 11914]NMO88610.1 hypothetical protein [Actinomycetospora sp. TBRC 11914]